MRWVDCSKFSDPRSRNSCRQVVFVLGTVRTLAWAERRWRRPESAISWQSSTRYDGAWPPATCRRERPACSSRAAASPCANSSVVWHVFASLIFQELSLLCQMWIRRSARCLEWNSTREPITHSFYRATACNATHGISKAFLSVRLSVDAWIVTIRKKLLFTFLYPWKIIHPSFWQEEWLVWWHVLSEVLEQTDGVRAKTIFIRYSLVAPQP